MRTIPLIILVVLLCSSAHSKIYKWVDENGSVHFSDTPYSAEAKEVNIRETGISINNPGEGKNLREKKPEESGNKKKIIPNKQKPDTKPQLEEKIITEADYKISSSVGKLGGDIMSISGRISSGPRCKEMTVTATAENDNGLSASITDKISKANSFGSTIFEGNAKVPGSAEDYGFWNVESVTIRCSD